MRGELPWQGLKAKTMKEKYEKIMEKKISTPVETLCKGFPEEFQVFILYTRDLKFDDRPDYGFLKKVLKTIIETYKLDIDNIFDWVLKKMESEKTKDDSSVTQTNEETKKASIKATKDTTDIAQNSSEKKI